MPAFLETMSSVYDHRPRMEHYACIVDMLGRARLLNSKKHTRFHRGPPEQPGIIVWQALLGACSIHGDNELGKWKERAGEIRKMKEKGVKKETGISWIELEKEVRSFVIADNMHPNSDIIYEVIAQLFSVMIDEGHIPV